ncbi:MAG: patatin-like phospholipase family protein [Bdellovibrionales bacterium]
MAFRILSLDGGGAWALVETQALIALYGEQTKGHKVLADFDLVAANSGGSLVLGGLMEDLTLAEIRDYFLDEFKRRRVFSPTKSLFLRLLRRLFGLGPLYSAEDKLAALRMLLPRYGDRTMDGIAQGIARQGRADTHLLIVGFNYDRNRAVFFRSAPAGNGPVWGKGAPATATMAEAIHASSNAPVNYFDKPARFASSDERFWDGGITGCNNPVLAAVTEAVVLGQRLDDLAVLSLGTGSVNLPLAEPGFGASMYEAPRLKAGLLNDLKKLATAILDDPPDAATFIAHVMTGGNSGVRAPAMSRIVRASPLIAPTKDIGGNWTAPGGMTGEDFKFLCDISMDAVDPAQIRAINNYVELWLAGKAPNQLIRAASSTSSPVIGYPTFSAAIEAWKSIR